MSRLLPLALLAALVLPATAQFKYATPAGEAPGPWLFGTIGVGKNPDKTPKTTALKGLAIKVGEKGEAAVVYDLDLCRMAGAWSGGKFTTPMNLMSRGEFPTALGEETFTIGETAGFRSGSDAWKDPRPRPFGPLPEVRFRGMYVHGEKTVLRWDVGGAEVLEMPGFMERDGAHWFLRHFEVAPHENEIAIQLGASAGEDGTREPSKAGYWSGMSVVAGEEVTTYKIVGDVAPVRYHGSGGVLSVVLAPAAKRATFTVKVSRDHRSPVTSSILTAADAARYDASEPNVAEPLTPLTKGGAPRWPETVETEGELSASTEQAYVVDTVKLPEQNPWGAPMFVGGFDFLPDGRAAVCTFHGDVFIASGIDAKLEKITWRRFASGLYHALGLAVRNGEIYVTCRDGIYRLRDLNGDGEADFYELWNGDIMVTKNFHEFVFDGHFDRDGGFYFAKAGPVRNGGRGFDEIVPHHGCLFRVSPDGKELRVVATGFRAPNGIGMGPNGELTSGENEGTWVPACKINWVKWSGFNGVVDLAHREPPPTNYDLPLCWLPKRMDNSGGSQVWVPLGEKWGPWSGQLLHLSYGQCALLGVMRQEVELPGAAECCRHAVQGGVVQFPGLKFQSGIMRARFHPGDGQLYVAGLRGWQTTGIKNGCLQRVRYTGAPVRMPIGLEAKKDGIQLTFTCSLDTKAAADPEAWNVEVWNYLWSSAYGSPELSTLGDAEKPAETGKDGAPQFTTAQMAKKGHDPLAVKSVKIGTDDRTIFLEIPGLKPVMQMAIKYQIKSADGADLNGEVVNTIHALAE